MEGTLTPSRAIVEPGRTIPFAAMSKSDVLRTLFNPQSVVVVGVSRDPIKRGRQVMRNVMSGGFGGRVYGIGRGMSEADGAPCFPTLDALPGPADVAFLAVSAETTCETLRECHKVGVKAAIISAAGFAENGTPAGLARQQELQGVIMETGIRLVGPNCNGIYNTANHLALGFNAAHAVRLPQGNIAILSHSGALFSVMAGYLNQLRAGLSLFVSAGNEADFDVLDYLEYALEDSQTRVIALLLDALTDGARFRTLALHAEALNKRIVALKIGTSDLGSKAALAHSSRLAGDADAYAALFEAGGVAAVTTLEGLMTSATLLGNYGRARGGLGAFTSSGAGASMIADIATKHGLQVPELSEETQSHLAPYLQFSVAGNPVDLGIFERGLSGDVPTLVSADTGIGAMMALVNPLDPNSGVPTLTQDLAQSKKTSGKPLVVVVPGGLAPEAAARYEADGMHVFPDTECTIAALGALLRPPRGIYRRSDDTVQAITSSANGDRLLALKRTLSEPESLALLSEFGVQVVPTTVSTSIDEAIDAAERYGWPVVAKAVVLGVAHKTEAGLVRTDLRSADALRAACLAFGTPAKIAIQPHLQGKAEAIAGLTHSNDTGIIMLAGLGGIYTEALRDVVMWSLPVPRHDLERKLSCSALGRLLASPRWNVASSLLSLITTLQRLQDFAMWAGDRIKAVDINPLILTEDGVVAVDGLIVPRVNES